MKHKILMKLAAGVIAATLLLQPLSVAAKAAANPFGDAFANLFGTRAAESDAFTTLQIREGSLNGAVVVDLLSPSAGWKLEANRDYYLYGVVTRPSGADSVQIRAGSGDGSFNGLTFFNPPGGTYVPANITHDYFDRLSAYDTIADPTYGAPGKAFPLQDGTVTYHIKDLVSTNESVTFAMGLIMNAAAYNGEQTLVDALEVAIGSVSGGSFTAVSSKSSSINVTPKAAIRAYYGGTVATAMLDSPGSVLNPNITESVSTNPVAMLYDKVEYDLYYPKGAVLSNIGFSAAGFPKTHNNYGTMTAGAPVVEGNLQKTHVTITSGYKAKNSSLLSHMQFTFPSDQFKAGQQCKIEYKNISITPQGGGTVLKIADASTPAVYTILDSSTDYSTLTALNRPLVYNHTIDTRDPYMVTMGSAQIINKSTSDPSPYAKTYEADFNITNTAAVISVATVPLGTNDNPQVTWEGVSAGGQVMSGTLANPADYSDKGTIAASKYLRLRASDFGIERFTSVKAEIGQLRANYNSSGSSGSWEMVSNGSGAFGHFTTGETGIQVKNTYRIYNTDPAQRNFTGGNLTVTTTATSTSEDRMGFTTAGATIKNESNQVVDSVAAGGAATMSGYVYPYLVPSVTKKGVLTGSDSLAVDPVIYLTLPTGLTYESLKFTRSEVRFDGTTNNNQPLSHTVENVSYLNTTGDGVSIYKVTFPAGTTLGHYSGEGSRFILNYTIKLRTSKSMETKRYELNRLIGISTQNNVMAMPYGTSPATLNTVMPDIYGMNGGNDYAGIAKGNPTEQPGFGLQQLAEVNVYNAVSVTKIGGQTVNGTWQNYDPSDPNSVASLGKNSEGQFRLNIQNTSDSASGELELLLPMPKKGVDMGDVFTEGPSEFDLSVDIPTEELAAEGFSGKYVTVRGVHDEYTAPIAYTDSNASSANAILLTATGIPAGADLRFQFPFKVTGGDAGATNIWRNAFQYTTSDNTIGYKTGSFVASSIASSSITGMVFDDQNRNGLHEGSEQGVSGATVVVRDSENKILSTVTDQNGSYTFLAVRETALTMTYTIPESKELRFNIPASEASSGSKVTPDADGLSATYTFTANGSTETVNAAASGYATLSYDKNSASATGNLPPNGEYLSGGSAEISIKPDNLLYKGYVFKEWNTAADATGTGYQPGQTMTVTDDVILYAIWEIGTYTVRFDYRGAAAGNTVTEKQLVHNQRYDTGGALPSPTRPGYSFKGWTATSTGTAIIANSAKFALGEDATLYAIWTPKNGYTVKYNTAGGSEIPNAAVTWEQVVRPANDPTRAGYEFGGWYYGVDEVTTAATFGSIAGADIPSLTLDAKWTAKAGYTVHYSTDGGTPVSDKTDVEWSQSSLLPQVSPTRENFAFGGWKLANTETTVTSVTTYGELAISEQTTAITLDAIWNVLANNTVSYETGGGTVYTDRTNVLPTDSGLIPTTAPVRAGYEFIGWMSGTKTVVWTTKYSELTSNAAVTITANWKAKSYTVQYSEGGFAAINRGYSDAGLIGGNTPKKDGSVFDEWYYGNTKVTDTTKISQLIPQDNAATLTLMAKWTEGSYTIAYESSGGGKFAPKTGVKYGATNLLPDSAPVRLGYTFAGWQSGTTTVTATTTCGSLSANAVGGVITLKAVWTEKTGYTVNYNTTGGSAVNSKTGVAWTATGLEPAGKPTRIGYEFKAWVSGRTTVTSSTAYGSIAANDAAGSSVTLVAQWSDATGYSISFETGTGTPVGDRANLTWNSKNLLPLHDVAPAGFKLVGWTFEGITVTPSTTYGELATIAGGNPVVLVAVYAPVAESGGATDVQGKVIDDVASAVYKIDISWGPMTFEYSVNNVWDPDNHSYVEKLQGWANEPFDGVNNRITTVNHSNADVEVSFLAAVEDAEAMDGVTMEMRQQNRADGDKAESMLLSRVPAESAPAPELAAYLWLVGTPENSSILNRQDYSKFGIINVSIRGTGSALTPKNVQP